jgi:hypothetical protein
MLGRHAPEEVLRVFKALWGIARDEVGEDAREGTVSRRSSRLRLTLRRPRR